VKILKQQKYFILKISINEIFSNEIFFVYEQYKLDIVGIVGGCVFIMM